MRLTRTYTNSYFSKMKRAKDEEKLAAEGYKIESIVESKRRNWLTTFILLIIFFPLALLGTEKYVIITYVKEDKKD